MADKKYVYSFGGGKADGNESMKNLLGGKGANLAEMAGHPALRLPVPPGFTITTELCTYYYQNKRTYTNELKTQVAAALANVEKLMGKKFGDSKNPLLVSVRSGARRSMPGMMDTVLNVGLNDTTVQGIIAQTNNPRFAYDAYRRLIMMYADVVMEKAAGIESKGGKGVRKILDERLEELKKQRGYKLDTEITANELKALVAEFKQIVVRVLGKPFPEDPSEQLWGGIGAVFMSWNGKRAVEYRRIEKIPDEWGTAVTVQSMVFGNMGDDSATGVAFTRNPGNGEKQFYGEYLVNAQGEDVVAGIRTPGPINDYSKNDQSKNMPTLEALMPALYKELDAIQGRLEKHYKDMQDIEFTIEKGKLFMLQCRIGKRNGVAAVRMATEMFQEKLIDAETAIMRVAPNQLVELLLPMLDPRAELATKPIAKGLPAGPGGATGRAVFTSEDAVAWAGRGEKVILVREETSPEDVDGMHKSQAILTSKGGMTSHAALVARGWGKCCIVGCNEIEIGNDGRSFHTKSGATIREGEWISLNGTTGLVYTSALALSDVDLEHNKSYTELMALVATTKVLAVRTNADTPKDAAKALQFGAEGIGLFRTEHMFYGEGSDKPLFLLRKMIMSKTTEERRRALEELSVFVKNDMKATLKVMKGLPVTIRLLDPPLHEFVPHSADRLAALGAELGVDQTELSKRAESLRENNPMLGHRGVRLGITYPEITEMQVRAILEAAGELLKEGENAYPEIMIPVTCATEELKHQKSIVDRVYAETCAKLGLKEIPYMYGTMIEIPRAALTAGKMADTAEFFSFGTNDLTQMSFGFSRDDIGSFLPDYLTQKILPADPFQTIDQEGVGELIALGINRGRQVRPKLKVGICGEHGGDADSVKFCHKVGMNYVSCSPFRVPIARLAAAQAVVEGKKTIAEKKSALAKQAAAVKKPAPKKPVAKKAVAKKAPAKKPIVKKAAVKKAMVKKPAVKKPAAKKPAAKKPAPKKSPVKKAVAKKPTVKKPAAKKPVTKKASAKKPTVKKAPAKKGKK
jgi:pyruvate,orthophosphate dikinase